MAESNNVSGSSRLGVVPFSSDVETSIPIDAYCSLLLSASSVVSSSSSSFAETITEKVYCSSFSSTTSSICSRPVHVICVSFSETIEETAYCSSFSSTTSLICSRPVDAICISFSVKDTSTPVLLPWMMHSSATSDVSRYVGEDVFSSTEEILVPVFCLRLSVLLQHRCFWLSYNIMGGFHNHGVVSAAVALTSSNFICVATISLVADFDVYSNTSGEATWFVLFHKRRKMP